MPGRRAAPFDFSLTVYLNEEPEGEPEQNGDVRVRQVSTGAYTERAVPKGDTPNL
jgi:hypothetical protein